MVKVSEFIVQVALHLWYTLIYIYCASYFRSEPTLPKVYLDIFGWALFIMLKAISHYNEDDTAIIRC